MNIVTALVSLFILALLVVIGYKVGQLIIELQMPSQLKVNATGFILPEENFKNETLRWNHFPLTVYIDTSFLDDDSYATDFRKAMENWEISTNNLISFQEVNKNADITVRWVSKLKIGSTDALGDTKIQFVNVSNIMLIQNAHIELLTKSGTRKLNSNDMINLALHEIGHALGLSHSNDEESIMYPVLSVPSNQVKQISDHEIKTLEEIYSIPAQADLRVIEVNATKATIKRFTKTLHLLNISLIIENVGIKDAASSVLLIKADNTEIKRESLPNISVGNKMNIIYGNLLIEHDFSTLEVLLDPDNVIDELNEENNIVRLSIT